MSDRTATGIQRCNCGHPSYTQQQHLNHTQNCRKGQQ